MIRNVPEDMQTQAPEDVTHLAHLLSPDEHAAPDDGQDPADGQIGRIEEARSRGAGGGLLEQPLDAARVEVRDSRAAREGAVERSGVGTAGGHGLYERGDG